MYFYPSRLNFLVILMVSALLNARTAQAYYAPVTTDNREFAETNQRTFHAMALNSGYGYQHMARWNQLSPPYNITAGNKIKRTDPEDKATATDKKQQNTATKNASARQKKTIRSVPEKTGHDGKNAHKKQQTKPGVAKKPKGQQQKSIVSIDNNKILELNFGWPMKGKVLKRFSPSRNKGIDIAGNKGQPVKATEAGKIVYGGQGLRGFGKLLIIKHNDDYLSAYANTGRLLVKEGQHVKKGQVIAEIGDAGIKRTSLHFEIRKNGKPVNPLKLLPKK